MEVQEVKHLIPCVHEAVSGQAFCFLCKLISFFLPTLQCVFCFFQGDRLVLTSAINQAGKAKIHQIAIVHRNAPFQRFPWGLRPKDEVDGLFCSSCGADDEALVILQSLQPVLNIRGAVVETA